MSDPRTSGAPTGAARRRARTRAALLASAREFLTEGRTTASIEEITKRARVGFGSFFNHFPGGKDELFDEAVLELLDDYAGWVRQAVSGLSDPAEAFACGFRLTGRLALAEPTVFGPLLARGVDVLFLERSLEQAALEYIEVGVDQGRFAAEDPRVHVVRVGSLLLGLVGLVRHAGGPGLPPIDDSVVDATAAAALRALGMTPADATDLISRELPPMPPLVTGSGRAVQDGPAPGRGPAKS